MHAEDRLDAAIERICRYEARLEAQFGLLLSIVATHPEKSELIRSWRGKASILLANANTHAGDDPCKKAMAEEMNAMVALCDKALGID